MNTAELQLQIRRGTAAQWTSADPTLLAGEIGYETDTGFQKWGDGSTAWSALTYAASFGGDVTISGTLNINADVAQFNMIEADAGVDQGYWRTTADGENLNYRIYDDALVNFYQYLTVERSGAGAAVQVDTIDLAAETDITVVVPDFIITGSLTVTEGLISAVTRVTTTYTILDTDQQVFGNTDAGAYTATLPVGVQGRSLRIVNTGTLGNGLTIAPDGAEELLGINSGFTLADGEALQLVYDATDGWY